MYSKLTILLTWNLWLARKASRCKNVLLMHRVDRLFPEREEQLPTTFVSKHPHLSIRCHTHLPKVTCTKSYHSSFVHFTNLIFYLIFCHILCSKTPMTNPSLHESNVTIFMNIAETHYQASELLSSVTLALLVGR